jgi:carboxylate-amine ligase
VQRRWNLPGQCDLLPPSSDAHEHGRAPRPEPTDRRMKLPELTLGIEEEYQIIDPETRGLTSYVMEMLEEGRLLLKDQIKPEFMQSQVEVGSSVCRNIGEVRSELSRLRGSICEIAHKNGLAVAAASTHPFSQWEDQKVTVRERYTKHEQALRDVARRLLIFGMHIHVGIEDKELMIDVMNQAKYFLPHLLALSTSSPFWHGRNTGLKSYRSVVFSNMPRSGPPPEFASYAEYQRTVDVLVKTGCIEEPTMIWWDIRPHPTFPTLEFRQSDICTKIDEACCITALVVSIVAKLMVLRQNNQSWRRYRHELIAENKWRAVRWGLDGDLIDFGKGQAVPTRDLIHELLELVQDVADELGVLDDVMYAETILEEGTSADRQIAKFEETGDMKDVMDQVIAETQEGIC